MASSQLQMKAVFFKCRDNLQYFIEMTCCHRCAASNAEEEQGDVLHTFMIFFTKYDPVIYKVVIYVNQFVESY